MSEFDLETQIDLIAEAYGAAVGRALAATCYDDEFCREVVNDRYWEARCVARDALEQIVSEEEAQRILEDVYEQERKIAERIALTGAYDRFGY